MAFLLLYAIFFVVYLTSITAIIYLLFNGARPLNLDTNFYSVVAINEFFNLIFVRTRSSLKFFPIMINLLYFIFLFYFATTLYGFYDLAFALVFWLSLFWIAYCLKNYEIPAMINWNPFHHYTPSEDKPRLMYFPGFSMNWLHDTPPFWTMFFPLADRSTFTQAQLSLVDRNNILLN